MNEPEELRTEDRGTLGLKPKGGRGKTRVLLVDDDRKFTAVLEQGLENTGNYDVHVENW